MKEMQKESTVLLVSCCHLHDACILLLVTNSQLQEKGY